MKEKMTNKRLVIAELVQKKSKNGKMYFPGRLSSGGAKVALYRVENKLSETGEPLWELVITH
jgi:hypothetical protein